jgi:hypothetical protein
MSRVAQPLMRVALAEFQAKNRTQGTRTDLLRDRVTRLGQQVSNNREYLLRRIARKHPDIFAAYERGEFASVRAAHPTIRL